MSQVQRDPGTKWGVGTYFRVKAVCSDMCLQPDSVVLVPLAASLSNRHTPREGHHCLVWANWRFGLETIEALWLQEPTEDITRGERATPCSTRAKARMGTKCKRNNNNMVLGGVWVNPIPAMITQDVQRLTSMRHIASRAMQSLIFSTNIVAEANMSD